MKAGMAPQEVRRCYRKVSGIMGRQVVPAKFELKSFLNSIGKAIQVKFVELFSSVDDIKKNIQDGAIDSSQLRFLSNKTLFQLKNKGLVLDDQIMDEAVRRASSTTTRILLASLGRLTDEEILERLERKIQEPLSEKLISKQKIAEYFEQTKALVDLQLRGAIKNDDRYEKVMAEQGLRVVSFIDSLSEGEKQSNSEALKELLNQLSRGFSSEIMGLRYSTIFAASLAEIDLNDKHLSSKLEFLKKEFSDIVSFHPPFL